ncbi:hypothetical protein K8M07_03855 [Schnuerera sp. xch1]|uniref:hypothetical protein n=1 Tax=Schnuerera sp. xch1 TaxID=2874283 RepID=UPI001CC16099|nr:hypothetical protein [Schnuerera sp. xch1]MBZ2174376.1 hypothetical protein [Schnuerera sp. xch1]
MPLDGATISAIRAKVKMALVGYSITGSGTMAVIINLALLLGKKHAEFVASMFYRCEYNG